MGSAALRCRHRCYSRGAAVLDGLLSSSWCATGTRLRESSRSCEGLRASPSLYIQTVDEAGREIDPLTLDMVQATIRKAVQSLQRRHPERGGRRDRRGDASAHQRLDRRRLHRSPQHGIMRSGVGRRGRGAHHVQLQLVRMRRPARPAVDRRPRNGARARLLARPRTAAHPGAGLTEAVPESDPTPEEQFHARIAYKRATGNRDPDQDHQAGVLALPSSASTERAIMCFLP